MINELNVEIRTQLDDYSCGPTCLEAIYRFYDDPVPIEQLVDEVPQLETGGTLAVLLARHALKRGYQATIFTYNLKVFDLTWFTADIDMKEKLTQQLEYKPSPRLRFATDAYLEFIDAGGNIRFEELTSALVRRYLKRNIPLLTGLSATYLYRSPRELVNTDFDDIRGEPQGHFVIVCGYDKVRRLARIADPFTDHSLTNNSNKYFVSIDRLIGAILLGNLTYDANILVIEPKEPKLARKRQSFE